MKYKILTITPTGCVIPVSLNGTEGTDYIETGDFEKAKALLRSEDYNRAMELWTPELIAKRQQERETEFTSL